MGAFLILGAGKKLSSFAQTRHKRQKCVGRYAGFSIIELVIAIVIVGIIAAVATSRLLQGDVYNAAVVRDQVVSLARNAQQQALGRSDVAMIIRPSGDYLEVKTVEGFVDVNTYTEMQSSTIDMRSVTMAGDVNVTGSCGGPLSTNTLSNASPMVVQFDELGDLYRGGVTAAAGYPITVTTGMRLCLNDDPSFSICFSPAGFSFKGDCE
jgi:MSHA pilin protein MshC